MATIPSIYVIFLHGTLNFFFQFSVCRQQNSDKAKKMENLYNRFNNIGTKILDIEH